MRLTNNNKIDPNLNDMVDFRGRFIPKRQEKGELVNTSNYLIFTSMYKLQCSYNVAIM